MGWMSRAKSTVEAEAGTFCADSTPFAVSGNAATTAIASAGKERLSMWSAGRSTGYYNLLPRSARAPSAPDRHECLTRAPPCVTRTRGNGFPRVGRAHGRDVDPGTLHRPGVDLRAQVRRHPPPCVQARR